MAKITPLNIHNIPDTPKSLNLATLKAEKLNPGQLTAKKKKEF